MLVPKKLKHRKQFRGKISRIAGRGAEVAFGKYGLKSLEGKWVTARQIEAARRSITRYIKRGGKVWIRIFPQKPVTAQPAETGMGGGKGSLDHFVAVVKPGQVLFEIDGVPSKVAQEAMRLASRKLAVKTKFLARQVRGAK